ncbi:MAG: hypothetical protein M3245_06405 [Actinomycetota bacterium]|nr:hypothetical protein [Actinomycetota bacterium]
MRRRTQLYLDEDQYRWLKRRAGRSGSIAGVVRELIDAARSRRPDTSDDPLIRYLFIDPPGEGSPPSSAEDLDRQVYGPEAP